MRIAITGSSGLIGQELVRFFSRNGDEITRVVRHPQRDVRHRVTVWDWKQGKIEERALERQDAIIHLAGESISGRWSAKRKQLIRESRVKGTRLLTTTLSRLRHPPRVLLSASAVGYYGNRPGDEPLTEEAAKGEGFLSDVTAEWEQAARTAEAAGIRVVHLRFGMVLSGRGGALAAMLPAFRWGLGGRLGDGRQVMSWISVEEIPEAVRFCLQQEQLSGPVNFVSPQPVTNAEFTRILGTVIHRPTALRLPTPLVRGIFGEMGKELLLSGSRVIPQRLLESGYSFRQPELPSALEQLL
ncbi:hypothetical protein GCM10011571_05890 [Marinithermofilum abyssi]|uniref:TIGR01777 family protein n=1 Tax=Marinithermofilum abyssi TaxID=1571185 RepID=A0A8J2VG79_9BACL|nr:TIGR01777 family oxidoreductase [Marinithermofilum abyssi]GGE07435.1 hypothetical protein GCM10011571_05890 [Marinithermofilum abyssi]